MLKEIGFSPKKYSILDNSPPVISLAENADLIIALSTSVLFDILPEHYEKIVIFDDVSKRNSLRKYIFKFSKVF